MEDRYGGGVSEMRGLQTGLWHEIQLYFFWEGGGTTTGAQVNPVINFVTLECLNQ